MHEYTGSAGGHFVTTQYLGPTVVGSEQHLQAMVVRSFHRER